MPKSLKKLVSAGLGIAMAGVVAVAVVELVVTGVAKPRMYSETSAPERPVALVLGAEIYPDGTPSPFLRGRLDVAKRLYDTGKVRAILVSGDNGDEHYNEPDGMRNYLVRAGVPADKVIADHAGFDTYDSCVRAKEIFGVDHLTVVSQEYHVPRAIATCTAVGVDAVGVGDVSVKPDSRTWYYGELRELAANCKLIVDLVTQRQPTLGPREDGVDRALAQ